MNWQKLFNLMEINEDNDILNPTDDWDVLDTGDEEMFIVPEAPTGAFDRLLEVLDGYQIWELGIGYKVAVDKA